ncbi:MAG: sigma-70 family RNA polymerase sigma factor [bacterium]|nr:sigma-70 family RNA polymerase sigma factor [bacterium]
MDEATGRVAAAGEERLLVSRCAAGDSRAWDRLLEDYGGLLYGIAARYCPGPDAARELFVHVIERLWEDEARRLRAWEGRAKLSSFLAAVAARVCADYRRGRYWREGERSREFERDGRERTPPGGGTARPDRVLRRECEGILRDLLGGLEPPERAAIELFYWQGLKYREIAAVLRVSASEVGKILLRSRARMGEMLAARGIRNLSDILE